MGNSPGKGARNLYITALANGTKFDRAELMSLQKEFKIQAAKSPANPDTITRAEFAACLQHVGIYEADKQVLERLFVVFDASKDDQINFKEFVAGCAPLVKGDTLEKIEFSFKLYDVDGSGHLSKHEITQILTVMNKSANQFGDNMLTDEEVDTLVNNIFSDENGPFPENKELNYADYLKKVSEHEILQRHIYASF